MGKLSKREKAWVKQMVDRDVAGDKSKLTQVLHDMFVDTPGYLTKRYYLGTSLQDSAVLAQNFKRRDLTKAYSNILTTWKKKKLLEIEVMAEGLKIVFTDRGVSELLKREIVNCVDKYPNGMYTMVVFDIPEHVRDVRNKWRRLLRISGFTMLQHSVWISNKRVSSELRALIENAKAERWIAVFEAVEK